MSTAWQRQGRRRRKQLPNWRVVRYADDFVVLVNGSRDDVLAVREDVSRVLRPLGLRLSQEKTQVTHLEDGIDFLGFHIQWRRKKGTDQWHVYTFIAKRPIRQLKAKIRALTRRQSQQDLKTLLIRINQIVRGWSAYFRHAVAKNQFSALADFIWWRVMRMLRLRHNWTWKDIRRRFVTPTGRWRPISAEGTELFDMAAVAVTRYRWRGARIPSPWTEIRA
jgi:RNA-directed DNA polymerase